MFFNWRHITSKGKPLGISYGKADNVLGETLKDVDSPVSTPKDVGNTTQESSPKDTSSSSSSSEWAGDKIPKEQLEKLQKRFKLTDEQMKQVMQKSKQEYQGEGNIDPGAFHRQLNLLVYVIIISVLVYVINRDYKDFISFWFARYFPVEARTLGMFVPEPRSKTA